ncbi:hypothetical protein [Paenisporosarcina quisquiliarum]|nr:hypothetical protein [Paenisporosarcina quisquiliarum]
MSVLIGVDVGKIEGDVGIIDVDVGKIEAHVVIASFSTIVL